MPKLRDSFRLRLDEWKFWVGVAYFGLVAVIISLFIVNNQVENISDTSHEVLCRLEADYKLRVTALLVNAGNVSESLRQPLLVSAQETVKAFQNLNCEEYSGG